MIHVMVYGAPDDPDGAPVDFITAGEKFGLRPNIARRYLDRPDVRALLRSVRRTFREAICAGNEAALQRIRDRSANSMAQLGAVRVLEQLDSDAERRPVSPQQVPGFVIVVTGGNPVVAPAREPLTIEHSANEPTCAAEVEDAGSAEPLWQR